MSSPRPSNAAIWAAMGAIYLFWGSTYLGIRIALESLPPFLMAGFRFAVAGLIFYAFARLRGAPQPTRKQVLNAALIGILLLGVGNGGVVWAEQWVASGLVAVIVAAAPVWMVGIDRFFYKGSVSWPQLLGVAVGIAGIVILVNPTAGGATLFPILVLLLTSVSWAAGTVYGRHAAVPAAASLANGIEVLTAAVVMAGFGLLRGEAGQLHLDHVSLRSLLALAWLITFGSLVGFSCYAWLIRAAPVVLVSTQAYISPVVALILGALIVGERITLREVIASAVIVVAVALIATAPLLIRPRDAEQLERVA
ncbi:MAG TPA: EamA family transporter [Candidatus Dormibacteraeota bacterium]